MTPFGALEAFLACVWLGGYLFTHFVVTPALASLDVPAAQRVRLRSVIGRRYGRLAAPFLAVWLAVVGAHGAAAGFDAALGMRLALIVVLALVAGVHGVVLGRRLQVLAQREAGGAGSDVARAREAVQRRSARLTPVALVASVGVAVGSLLALAGGAP